jgi:alkylation response protein AidB-like acyl-CoA dehydrogenase
VLAASIIESGGTDAQKRRRLPAIARGERTLVPSFTEATYGPDTAHVQMKAAARRGGYVLNGAQRFVPDAGAADELIVAARDGDAIVLVLVDANATGVERTLMSGFSGWPLFEVTFSNVDAGADAVLGGPGNAWDALEPALDAATAVLCAYMAGATRRVYELSMAYAQQRVQFGQPIARFQRVQDHLIEMLNHADAARWTAYEAGWKLEHNKPGARSAVSVAKAVASEGFYQACEAAHHVHGGIGSDRAYGLYLYTERSRSLYHYLGDPVHHRRRLARLLGL